MQVHAFILQRPPQTLDHAVINPAAFAVHANLDLRIAQYVDPVAAGKLAALDALLSVKRRSEPDLFVCGDAR